MKKYFLLLVSALFLANPAKAVTMEEGFTALCGDNAGRDCMATGVLDIKAFVVSIQEMQCEQDMTFAIMTIGEAGYIDTSTLSTLEGSDQYIDSNGAPFSFTPGICSVTNGTINPYTVSSGQEVITMLNSEGEEVEGFNITGIHHEISDDGTEIQITPQRIEYPAGLKTGIYTAQLHLSAVIE